MYTRSKLVLAALGSALLLAAFVGSASANRLSQNETGFRDIYTPLTFVPSFGTAARCPVTLEGTFHSRTITKTEGTLVGFVTRVSVGTCESGRARADTETLPWHIQYGGFTGTLPNITGITQYLIRPTFEIGGEIFGQPVTCRYTTPRQKGINTRETRGVVTAQRPGEERTASETQFCPEGRQEGTARVTTASGGTFVVSLI